MSVPKQQLQLDDEDTEKDETIPPDQAEDHNEWINKTANDTWCVVIITASYLLATFFCFFVGCIYHKMKDNLSDLICDVQLSKINVS